MSFRNRKIVKAVLGPTNTGKTFYAVERMLAYKSGMIGFPLRLLAREIYDKILKITKKDYVALITGEERIIPPNAKYWICTVEAMPVEKEVEFLGVDEIQLCADRERGHIFSNRLLNARGKLETIFMGSETIKKIILNVIPNIEILKRKRFSNLKYNGKKKLSRIPERSAIVSFSVDEVYAIAEIIRRKKGGAAVVMGALSPRTRNAQVDLYQNGEVDYLVATDAIGMGLNLDIKHVAFSKITKFDGEKERLLYSSELGQIAGRAGRHISDGTFGITGNVEDLKSDYINKIEKNFFPEINFIQWRNSFLDFSNIECLIKSLELQPNEKYLVKTIETDDLKILRSISENENYKKIFNDSKSLFLLWEVCKIPDFRKISFFEHYNLILKIFKFLYNDGTISDGWLYLQIKQIDKLEGDIDTISKRISFVRTLTYISNKKGWTKDQNFWQGITRKLEDKLSDVLHQKLVQSFIDVKTSVLSRSLKQRENLVAEINEKNEVFVEGQLIGRLDGFIFEQEKTSSLEAKKTLSSTAHVVLESKYLLKSEKLYNSFDGDFEIDDFGNIIWDNSKVGVLVRGDHILKPKIKVLSDVEVGKLVIEKIEKRLNLFLDRHINKNFESLILMSNDVNISGLARGISFQIFENLGIIPREKIKEELKSLNQNARGMLRKYGIRFGQYTVYHYLMLKPAPTKLRLILKSIYSNNFNHVSPPSPGLVTIKAEKNIDENFYLNAGFRLLGKIAIRIDMLERLANLIRNENVYKGFFASSDMLSITGLSFDDFSSLMEKLGFSKELLKPINFKKEKKDDDLKRVNMNIDMKDLDQELKEPNLKEKFFFKLNKQKNKKENLNKKLINQKSNKMKNRNSYKKNYDPNNPFAALIVLKKK